MEKDRLVGLKKKFKQAAAIEEKGKAVIEKKGQIAMVGLCMNSRRFLLGMVCRRWLDGEAVEDRRVERDTEQKWAARND